MAFVAYLSATLFLILFVLVCYNIWKFGCLQGKWRVWSLSLFYSLTTLCVILRIWISINCVCIANQFNLWLILEPAVLKVCIGIEQIMVVIEITLKVRENQKAIQKVNSYSINGRLLMNELVASKKKVAFWVKILQIMVTIFITLLSLAVLATLIWENIEYSDKDNMLDRLHRAQLMGLWA